MGCGVSHSNASRDVLTSVRGGHIASDVEPAIKPVNKTNKLMEVKPSSKELDGSRNIQVILSGAERTVSALKTQLTEGTLASDTAVALCKELLQFSGSVDESEEILSLASTFVTDKKVPQLVFEINGALRTKYPDIVNYDREKETGSPEQRKLSEIQQAQDVLNLLAGVTVNLTDVPQLAVEYGSTGLIPVFLEMTKELKDSIPDMIPFEDPETKIIHQFTARGRTLSRVLGALVNLAKQASNRVYFNDCNGVQYLLPLLKSKVSAYYIKSLFCLAYLIDEDNNETIMANAEPIRFIIQMLDKATRSPSREYLGFSTSNIADGLSQLAVNESNSTQIGLNGGIPVIVNMLRSSQHAAEKLGGTKALWMLSFNSTNRELIRAVTSAIEVLHELKKHPADDVSITACGVLWELEKNRDVTSSVPSKQQHVMISYQWDAQDTMIQVKNKLTSEGFSVWMDVDYMKGSTLESMAAAVEHCAVFLMATSRKYKESPNCRSEAEYAFQLRKDIVPLMMEPRFQPDGWLGIIVGTKLWMDFREARTTEKGINHLIRELGSRGKHPGNDQEKSKNNELKKTLQSYKQKHRSVYVYLSEGEKLIKSLRAYLMSGQLATEAAFWKVDALVALYVKIPDQPSRSLVLNFFVEVNLPELLIDIVKSLRTKYSVAFSQEMKKNNNATEEKKSKNKKKAAVKTRSEEEQRPEVGLEINWALEVMLSSSVVILNCTDLHDGFCEACGEGGLVLEYLWLAEQLKNCAPEVDNKLTSPTSAEDKEVNFTRRESLLFDVLGVLHNLAKRTSNKKHFDDSGAVQTMLCFFRTDVPVYRMTALLGLAYLVDEKNNHLIMASEEPIKDIIQLLEKACNSADRRRLGFSAAEIALGLGHVATSDGNKRTIGQLGGISLLASMLKNPESSEEEKLAATKALYMLAFDETNKEAIKADHDTVAALESLQKSVNKEIHQAAAGVLWEIEGKKEHVESSESEEHVMISYQWDTQLTMLQVKEKLEASGFSVWMDLEQMEGSILETMARAVEQSSVLLLAVSQKYQNSPNCRSEAEYAYQRRKRVIPLMMEASYSPDGWLGMILGTKLWMDFRGDPRVGMDHLMKELRKTAAPRLHTSPSVATRKPKKETVYEWKNGDVAKWLQDIGFDVASNEVRRRLDGPLLVMLNDLRRESPEFFYNSIKTDLGLPTVIEVLQFTKELKELLD